MLEQLDPEIFSFIEQERVRQRDGLEMIASENYVSLATMEAQGSILTNKYAEGYPQKRYYGGCEFVDKAETLAIERVKELFKAKYANVQPHSGSQANMAAYFALLEPGDTILGMDLSAGGHLTHGHKVSFSGKLFKTSFYGVDPSSGILDYKDIKYQALKNCPKLIVAGASSYPRQIDFKRFREIADEINAFLMVDMAHIAGLVATGLHPDPLPHAHIVTSTTHKTLRGPRGGIILTNDQEIAKKMNSNIFPGIQGGPLQHVIAAKAVAFKEALDPSFKTYQEMVVANAKELAKALETSGVEIISGGTDNHLLLVKTDSIELTGKEAEDCLEKINITCNKNMVPGDKASPSVTSGIRLGTPAITTRGLVAHDMKKIGEWIYHGLKNARDEMTLHKIREEVMELCRTLPLHP